MHALALTHERGEARFARHFGTRNAQDWKLTSLPPGCWNMKCVTSYTAPSMKITICFPDFRGSSSSEEESSESWLRKKDVVVSCLLGCLSFASVAPACADESWDPGAWGWGSCKSVASESWFSFKIKDSSDTKRCLLWIESTVWRGMGTSLRSVPDINEACYAWNLHNASPQTCNLG